MNIERLEMMKQMMGRVVAGSWSPVDALPADERFMEEVKQVTVSSVDLMSWADHKKGRPGGSCGFSACAVGHACFDEEFRKLGWRFNYEQPMFAGKLGWGAVEKFFGIDEKTAEMLFMNRWYTNKAKYAHVPSNVREAQMVLDRVDLLIQLNNQQEFKAQVRKSL